MWEMGGASFVEGRVQPHLLKWGMEGGQEGKSWELRDRRGRGSEGPDGPSN